MNLLGKKVTLLLLPQGAHEVKRYTVRPRLLTLGFLFMAAVIVGLSLFTSHLYLEHNRLAIKAAESGDVRRTAAMQETQIHAFADKLRILEQEMAKLRQFDQKLRAMNAKTPLIEPEAASGVGGSDSSLEKPKNALKLTTEEMVRRMHSDIDRLLAETTVQELNQQQLGRLLQDTSSILACTPEAWPLNGALTSYFGYRPSPFGGRKEFHRGLDIKGPTGAPIKAPADGVVVDVEWNSGYGTILTINHGYGLVTRYAHLSQAYVEPGQRVERGELICAVGASGRVTGPHLHYEVIMNGIPVNPMRFLAKK